MECLSQLFHGVFGVLCGGFALGERSTFDLADFGTNPTAVKRLQLHSWCDPLGSEGGHRSR